MPFKVTGSKECDEEDGPASLLAAFEIPSFLRGPDSPTRFIAGNIGNAGSRNAKTMVAPTRHYISSKMLEF